MEGTGEKMGGEKRKLQPKNKQGIRQGVGYKEGEQRGKVKKKTSMQEAEKQRERRK